MKRLIFFSFVLASLFLLMPLAQGSNSISTTVFQRYPGIYINDRSSLTHNPYDPATNYDYYLGGSIIKEIYEGLMDFNGNNATLFRPMLATSYTISPDGLNYTFTIRQGVNFTDGSPLNAYVMQYSIQRAIIMNDPYSGIWMLDQSIRNASWIGAMSSEHISQANDFLGNMSVHANSAYSLSIYLSSPSAAFIPELIFPAADAVSPSWIITNEPSNYNSNQSDANIYGMVSLAKMFPQLSNTSIRNYLGLNDTTAYPSLDNSGIVPQSPAGGQNSYTYFKAHAMGTGPYMLTSETSNVTITLTRNDHWWNSANFHRDTSGNIDAPQQIVYETVSSDSAKIANIENNNAHTASIGLSNLGTIMNITTHVPYINNINVYTYPSLVTSVLGFNENQTISTAGQISTSSSSTYTAATIMSNDLLHYAWNSSFYASPNNPFTALAFRRAFAYAWDYQNYMSNVLKRQDNRLSGVIPAGLFGHQTDLISAGYIPSQNLVLAKQLFQKVGWQGTITVNYNANIAESQADAQLMASVIDNLGVGITIKVTGVQWSNFINLNYESGAAMFFLGWAPDYADASDYTVPFLHTGDLFPIDMHYSNPHVDALMDKADVMTVNNATKNALYREMEINASGDYPFIYLNQANNINIENRWVTDWSSANAGNENPMNYGTRYQYVGLEAYTPNTAITTPMTSTTSSTTSSTASISTVTTTTTTISTSTVTATYNNTSNYQSSSSSITPGFEAITLITLLMAASLIIRKKKINK